jgi:hypothetical protein
MTTNKDLRDSQIDNKPIWSTEVKCKSLGLRKHTWHLDIYSSYAIFTDQQTSKQFRFPDEAKRHGFATSFISGYNFSSDKYRFLIDKQSLKYLKNICSSRAHLSNEEHAKRRGITEQEITQERKRLVSHVRFWSGLQLVVSAIILVGAFVSPRFWENQFAPFLIAAILVWSFVAVSAWRLQKWAIFCQMVLYTASSLWNAIMLLLYQHHGQPIGKPALYLSISIFVAQGFFRAFKARLSPKDYMKVKETETKPD